MWLDESVFYQIYPIGFCGAPRTALEEGQPSCNRIGKVIDWIDHIKRLGCNAVYFSPLFESDSHGYDTRDFRLIDRRLGSNQDFAQVCQKLHEAGIRVVLDGVFNHVGRGFWAFRETCSKSVGILRTRIGSASPLTAIPPTTTDSGMRAGKDIMSWSN